MKTILLASALAAAGTTGALAQSATTLPATGVPRAAFFAGAGGAFNSTSFEKQNLYSQGVSNIYLNGALYGQGYAGGNVNPNFQDDQTLSPMAQLGYFQHFGQTDWLWGAKFTYNYLGASATSQNLPVPQAGAFTGNGAGSFTGNVVVHSYKSQVDNQFALIPFLGRSFGQSFVYAGAGPTLSRVQSSLDGVIGFADINGTHYDITGAASSFNTTQWVYGGAATVGMTYFIDAAWFIDLNYTYARTQTQTNSYATPFSTTASGFVDRGILSGNDTGRQSTQTVAFSINRAF